MLRRISNWLLIGALVICAILFIGLIHDFTLDNPQQGWFTSRPLVPGVLVGVGLVFMVLQHFGAGGEE